MSANTEARFRILYLGSDLEFITGLRERLPEDEYRFVTCSDTGSAMLFLQSEIVYHLLLMDFDWKGMNGLEMSVIARTQQQRKTMPIILLMNAALRGERKAQARKAGVDECLKKKDLPSVVNTMRRLAEPR